MQCTTPEAQKALSLYINKLEAVTRTLPAAMQTDLRNELLGHIADSMEHSKKDSELEKLNDALDRLGDPAQFLKPMIADYQTEVAVRTFHPMDVARAFVKNIGAGVRRTLIYSVFFVLYLTLFSFALVIVGKLFIPANTGLFFVDGHFHSFGIVFTSAAHKEVLGYWLLPLASAGLVLDYLFITFLLKVVVKKRKP